MAIYLLENDRQGAPDINSYVYNALSDVAFELSQSGYDINKEKMQKALDNFMRKFFINENLKEANYGGAYDIDPESFFTKEEIVEFGNDIVETFNKDMNEDFWLSDIYTKTYPRQELYIEIEGEDYIFDTTVSIDMRKIKLPRDINKYKNQILDDLERQYTEYHQYDNYYESYKLTESSVPENIWTAVCSGDLNKVKKLVPDYETANLRWNKFGKNHSLIMGAARNGNPSIVTYLLKIGGTIEPHETKEFFNFIENNIV